jgi:hypothetical protein
MAGKHGRRHRVGHGTHRDASRLAAQAGDGPLGQYAQSLLQAPRGAVLAGLAAGGWQLGQEALEGGDGGLVL